ncbi:hypothetical protein E1180_20945 [Roseibium denhamense]|nr:hypothetical protein [Roseibium denhamense]
MPSAVPAAVVVDIAAVPDPERKPFFDWLSPQIQALSCEVPVYILTDGQDHVPQVSNVTAILERQVPDDVLLMLICIHQRALIRSDEARIRRQVFGSNPAAEPAPHHSGTSSLLVIGLSGRFLEWQAASDHKVEVIGAFDGNMATEFMSQRAFDAVVIDTNFEESIDYMQQIRRDARFAGIPVLAVCEGEYDAQVLFRNGASDVLLGSNLKETLSKRLEAAIRFGKRRRLADRVLAQSHNWLRQQFKEGGLSVQKYTSYLETCSDMLASRGLDLWEMRLIPENFGVTPPVGDALHELQSTLLSIADATSRDEDLVCLVHELGPVAVLKNEAGPENLRRRIHSIIAHTVL